MPRYGGKQRIGFIRWELSKYYVVDTDTGLDYLLPSGSLGVVESVTDTDGYPFIRTKEEGEPWDTRNMRPESCIVFNIDAGAKRFSPVNVWVSADDYVRHMRRRRK